MIELTQTALNDIITIATVTAMIGLAVCLGGSAALWDMSFTFNRPYLRKWSDRVGAAGMLVFALAIASVVLTTAYYLVGLAL